MTGTTTIPPPAGEGTRGGPYARHLESIHASVPAERFHEGFEAWYGGLLPADRAAPILDLGCGRGQLLRYLALRGHTSAEGFDVISEFARGIRESTGFPVHVGDDPRAFLAGRAGSFELITLLDVLEHIPVPEIIPLLESVRRALRAGGRVIVSGPHAASLTGLYTRYLDLTHTTCFTLTSLRYALESAGFEGVVSLEPRIRLGLRPGRWGLLLAQKLVSLAMGLLYRVEAPGDPSNPPHFHRRIAVAAGAPR
ncbi:MAG: class I SAM-dependent methyltransferase [Planctomycetota bacterium]